MATRVYVGGLSHRCRERDLERFFRKYGRLREISLKNGYAFVEFDDYRDADDAVYECNGKDLMGDRVSIEIAKGTPHGRDRDRWGHGSQRGGGRDRDRSRSPYGRGGRGDRDRDRDGRRPGWLDKYGPPTRTDFRCTVENLSSRVSWQDLKDYMRQAGEVTYADAHKTRKNEGTVEFGSIDDMKTAIEKLDGTELNGRKIRLVEQKRRRSSRSDSRSRSRSPRRSRSRSGGRRDRGRDRSRSRSRSNDRDNGKDRSRSKSRSKSMEKVKAKESSRSRSRDRDASRSRSRTPRSRSRSRSRGGDGDRDRSRSRSGSRGGDDANGRSSPAQERERMDDEDNRDD